MLRQAVDIGIAVDDGRMGRSPWKLGAFIIPDKNFAAWLAPQTHQEFLAPAVLLPDGDGFDIDVVDAAEQQAKEDEWLQAHDRRNAGPKQPQKKKAKAQYRLKSKRFVVEVDNMLRCVPHNGPGLVRFQAPVDFQSILGDACLQWPCLVISADQGPDCNSAQNWMEDPSYGRINLIREPDSHNHGIHNDTLGAATETGLGGFLYGMTVVLNLHFLPWSNGTYGNMLRNTAANIAANSAAQPATFLEWFDIIAKEKGCSRASFGSKETLDVVWRAFCTSEYLNKAGQKVGLCRWYQLIHRLRCFMPDWTSALLVLCRACQDETWFNKIYVYRCGATEGTGDIAVEPGMPGTSEVRTPTKKSAADEIKQLRRACKHAFHFVILFLASIDNRRVGSILSTLTHATESWYTKQAKRLKCSEENHAWVLEQLGGDFWVPLRETFKALMSPAELERMEFDVQLSNHSQDRNGTESDSKYSRIAGKFVQSLVRRRAFRSAWFTDGWPQSFIGFLGGAERREETGRLLKETYEAYEVAKTKDTVFYNSICSKSPFRLPAVRQMSEPLRANGWVASPEVLRRLEARNKMFKQSRVVENGFLLERQEESAHTNCQVSEATVFHALASGNCLTSRRAVYVVMRTITACSLVR
jgi:hypothetical protein